MEMGKAVLIGIAGTLYQSGIEITELDFDKQILKLVIPARSYEYEEKNDGFCMHNAPYMAKQIKNLWINLGIFKEECHIYYKEKDIYWSKEMGDSNLKCNKDDLLKIFNT